MRENWKQLAVGVLTVAVAAGSSQGCRPARQSPPPSLVLVSIDTLRSDHLTAYGANVVRTPAIDGLRRDGILYSHAYANVPLTLPSHVSLLSGLLPSEHGVRDNLGFSVADGLSTWLPAQLHDAGYATAAVVSSVVLRRETGVGRGFDVFDDDLARPGGSILGEVARPGVESVERALAWLDGVGPRPFFLWLHVYEPHSPYAPPEPFASQYRERPYDGEIAAADRAIGLLTEGLELRHLYERAVVILLSDHGEGLGDHGEAEHGIFLYREALQVPLLIKLPHASRAGETVERPVQLIDVYATALDLAHLPMRGGQSRSLLSVTGRERRLLYAESYYARLHYGFSELLSGIVGQHQYVESPTPEYFDLAGDPRETVNRFEGDRRAAMAIRQALLPLARQARAPSTVDAETRSRLAALQYLVGSATPGDGSFPDPKAHLDALQDMGYGIRLFREGSLESAEGRFARVVQVAPRAVDAWDFLGRIRLLRHQRREALDAFSSALASSGDLAAYGLVVGTLQLALAEPHAALRTFDACVKAHIETPLVLTRLSESLLRVGRWSDAETSARRAVAMDKGAAEAWNNLGVALRELGRSEEALAAWTSGLTASPRDSAMLYNFGTTAARLGHDLQAKAALRSYLGSAVGERASDVTRARTLLGKLEGHSMSTRRDAE